MAGSPGLPGLELGLHPLPALPLVAAGGGGAARGHRVPPR